MLNVHSTRLFPKDLGAHRYRISGVAARCEWVVLSDKADPQTHLMKRRGAKSPETVFLSCRWQRVALQFFVETVLPQITAPFILVSGSEDTTIPNQIDTRMTAFNDRDRAYVATILEHPHLKYWVAENLDDHTHHKLHPLPLGMVFNEAPEIRDLISIPNPPPLGARPLIALCGHRTRAGDQWATRRQVTEFAIQDWSAFCTTLEEDVSEQAFIQHIEAHAFVICVAGGGLDPSPKAWLSLLHGAIPIIKRGSLDAAYERLPVAFVEDWTSDAISIEKLTEWRTQMQPLFDQPSLRRSVIKRLSLDYWWDYIRSLE